MKTIRTVAHADHILATDFHGNHFDLDRLEWPADMDSAHHMAAMRLAEKMGWRAAALIGGATAPGIMVWLDVTEIAHATAELVRLFLNGDHYATRNPYSRPQVKAGLIALQLMLRKDGEWMNAMSANDSPLILGGAEQEGK